MYEFLFKYSAQTFNEGAIVFSSDWSTGWLILLVVISVSLISIFLYRNRQLLTIPQLSSIGVLQLLMVTVVLVALWQPALLTEQLRSGDNVIAMMLDTSESMTYGTEDESRVQRANALIDGTAISNLKERYEFKNYVFSNNAAGRNSPMS